MKMNGGRKKPSKKNHGQPKARKAKDTSGDYADPVDVFCRVRPIPPGSDLCVFRTNDTTVVLRAPTHRNGFNKETQHTFKHVFGEEASQKEVFQDVGLPLVSDLLHGKNGLLFTYGITSSGKTFTMVGKPDNPGIVPRTLDVIFNSLSSVLASKYLFKPDTTNGFEVQSEVDAMVERQRRDLATDKPSLRARTKPRDGDTDFSTRDREESVIDRIDDDCLFSVFISYVEIYNNYAFDLLEIDVPEYGGKISNLPSHQLREDVNKVIYISGASEIEVKTADEALQLLVRGQKLRRMASTLLNDDSSRGHTIFNIRIVQAPLDRSGREVIRDKDLFAVSQLSLVDLAGSERTKRTGNEGDRLREAGSINTSLMALRNCLEALRLNQKIGQLSSSEQLEIVPYRNSKLTLLFKNYFEGKGKVRMIVCINPQADEYEETINVFRFAESTQEVQVNRSQRARYDQLGLTPGRRVAAEESKKRLAADLLETHIARRTRSKHFSLTQEVEVFLTFPNIKLTSSTDSETLPNLAKFLEERIRHHKDLYISLKNQVWVRSEMAGAVAKTFFESDRSYDDLLFIEIAFFKRLRQLLIAQDDLRKENLSLRLDVEDRDNRIDELQNRMSDQLKLTQVLMKSSTLSEQEKLDLMNKLGDRDYAVDQEHTKRQKYESKLKGHVKETSEKRNKEFERRLNETKTAYASRMEEKEAKLKRIREAVLMDLGHETTPSSVTPSAPFQSSTTSTLSTSREVHLDRNYSRLRQVGPRVANDGKSPFHNPRYGIRGGRRSKSSDNCLEHRSKNRVPIGTRMQPTFGRMERRKSVTKLEFSDTKDAQTYILEHQQADSDGNVETQLFKGDIIPTSSGGRAVIFNDVETLRQEDPGSFLERRQKFGTPTVATEASSSNVLRSKRMVPSFPI